MHKLQIYIDTKETSITVRNKCFFIENEKHQEIISAKRIESIAIISNANINASAIKLAAINDISILYYNYTGGLVAQLRSPDFLKHPKLRHKQLHFMNDSKGILWAKSLLVLKTKLQIETIKRYGCLDKKEKNSYKQCLLDISDKLEHLKTVDLHKNNIQNSLMGYEGVIARVYFKAINTIIPKEYSFLKRSRRPGKDYFNATLNYVYGLTYTHVTKALHAAGLDTFCGALHTTPYKESLVFDCIEPFRPIMDRLLIDLCIAKSIKPNHFTIVKGGFWLSKTGKKLIITNYGHYLKKKIKIDGKITSIKNHIYVYAQQLKLEINLQDDLPNTL